MTYNKHVCTNQADKAAEIKNHAWRWEIGGAHQLTSLEQLSQAEIHPAAPPTVPLPSGPTPAPWRTSWGQEDTGTFTTRSSHGTNSEYSVTLLSTYLNWGKAQITAPAGTPLESYGRTSTLVLQPLKSPVNSEVSFTKLNVLVCICQKQDDCVSHHQAENAEVRDLAVQACRARVGGCLYSALWRKKTI